MSDDGLVLAVHDASGGLPRSLLGGGRLKRLDEQTKRRGIVGVEQHGHAIENGNRLRIDAELLQALVKLLQLLLRRAGGGIRGCRGVGGSGSIAEIRSVCGRIWSGIRSGVRAICECSWRGSILGVNLWEQNRQRGWLRLTIGLSVIRTDKESGAQECSPVESATIRILSGLLALGRLIGQRDGVRRRGRILGLVGVDWGADGRRLLLTGFGQLKYVLNDGRERKRCGCHGILLDIHAQTATHIGGLGPREVVMQNMRPASSAASEAATHGIRLGSLSAG